jgi:hypothetical protein
MVFWGGGLDHAAALHGQKEKQGKAEGKSTPRGKRDRGKREEDVKKSIWLKFV